MSIFVVGINHKTAPVALREKIYFALDKLSLYLQDLINRDVAREAVLLSTCNRSELYCDADNIEVVRDWFCAQHDLSPTTLLPVIYTYRDEQAVAHMMQVACGLDSMILGEPQILGQMKEAFAESCTAGAVSMLFHRLFQQIFAFAKEVRTTTAIGACPVSVASAAVHFARQRYLDFTNANMVLIGGGDTGQLLIRYLKTHLTKPLTLINRSMEKALTLADEVVMHIYGFDQLVTALASADIVFSATGSAMPVVTQALVMEAMQTRPEKPLMLIDIAVPRDIDAAVAELNNVKLFCIDDLKAIIEKNLQGRSHAADKAREMIRMESCKFIADLKSLDSVTSIIRAYRRQVEEICRIELIKAKQQLHQGEHVTQVLDAFAHAFTRKLLHSPSVQLRQAGAEGRFELLQYAKELFAIPDAEIEMI